MSAIPTIEIDIVLTRPIPVNILAEDGTTETVMIPRLGIEGLMPWLDEITAKRQRDYRIAAAKVKLDAKQAIDAEMSASQITAVISDLGAPVQTPAGIRRVFKLAIEKATINGQPIPADKQAVIVDAIMLSTQAATLGFGSSLAERLHCLFPTGERRPAPQGGGGGPLAVAGSGQNAPDQESNTIGSSST